MTLDSSRSTLAHSTFTKMNAIDLVSPTKKNETLYVAFGTKKPFRVKINFMLHRYRRFHGKTLLHRMGLYQMYYKLHYTAHISAFPFRCVCVMYMDFILIEIKEYCWIEPAEDDAGVCFRRLHPHNIWQNIVTNSYY